MITTRTAITMFVTLVAALFVAHTTSDRHDLDKYPKVAPNCLHNIQGKTVATDELHSPIVKAVVAKL